MKKTMFQRLLSLVNSSLWNKQIDESLFAKMDDIMWNELYRFAVRHGVMAIAYDGVLRLSSDLRPPLKLRMAWALSTKQIEDKYEHILDVATELSAMLRKEQMNMLIFKGLKLSSYYPIPTYREFGDIDI